MNEGNDERPKFGFVSDVPGSRLVVRMGAANATAFSHHRHQAQHHRHQGSGGHSLSLPAGAAEGEMHVTLGYLRSYVDIMGRAVVRCATGAPAKSGPGRGC